MYAELTTNCKKELMRFLSEHSDYDYADITITKKPKTDKRDETWHIVLSTATETADA